MKIVYVYPQFAIPAGTERVLIDKMNYLAGRDYDILMLTNEQGNRPIVFPISQKIRHVDINVQYSELYKKNAFVRYVKKIQLYNDYSKRYNKVLREYKPDIVVSSTYFDYIISAVAKCKLSYTRILESHIDKRFIYSGNERDKKNVWGLFRSSLMKFIVSRKAKSFDYLITLNQEDSVDWSRYVKTIVITNVVHLNSTGQYSDQTQKRVIFVGRYAEQKGISDLFKIWKLVHSRYPDWCLELYGDGMLKDKIKGEADALSINIFVCPPEINIFPKYINSSIFVLTSYYEPFGLVIPEAMSCGLPVVSFDCPYGPRKIIKDDLDGYLVKDRDVQLFAYKVCKLIESRELRLKMGAAGIQSSKRFSVDAIMPQWESLFYKIVEDG